MVPLKAFFKHPAHLVAQGLQQVSGKVVLDPVTVPNAGNTAAVQFSIPNQPGLDGSTITCNVQAVDPNGNVVWEGACIFQALATDPLAPPGMIAPWEYVQGTTWQVAYTVPYPMTINATSYIDYDPNPPSIQATGNATLA